jgi:beta-glucosidase
MKKYLLIAMVTGFMISTSAQTRLPYKDATLSIDLRVKDLLARMTPEEKFWQLFMIPGGVEKGEEDKYRNGIFGFQVSAASANGQAAGQLLNYNATENAAALAKKINTIQRYFIEQTRLGIPIIAFDEALHGLVREGATVFPQAIALAATWDTTLMSRVAEAIATEAAARGIRQVLSPVINIASDVRWGRTEETYGEDPFLTSAMGVAFVSAFEKRNIITTPKHFIANVGDGGRDSYPIHFNERLLEEIYFPPFKACIEKGGSRSVMTAYNSVNGSPATANDWLLNKVLKSTWQFPGFVISDASAVGGANVLHYTSDSYPTSSRQAITNGLDVIFQTAWEHHRLFNPPFLDNSIPQQRIDDAVARVLKAKFELGLFEHPYINEKEAAAIINSKQHKALAKEAALKSIVLLKNEKNTLPFSRKIKNIAVIGVDAREARLGGYSGPGNGKVSILDGIRRRAGTALQVSYTPGPGRHPDAYTLVPASCLSSEANGKTRSGLQGTYYNNITLHGEPAVKRTDAQVNFHWTLFSPAESISPDHYSAQWTGFITAPQTGTFSIGLEGNDGFRLYIDNKLMIDNWKKQTYSTLLVKHYFQQHKRYAIRIEFFEAVGNAHLKLVWNAGVANDWNNKIKEAVAAAQKADIAVVVAGIDEGEFQDRASLALPGHQEALIRQVAATGKPVVVILVGGSAITMANWLHDAAAVADAWYPGEEGGNAIADVLFGDENPAGRLPITFPVSEAQLPLVYNHKPTGRGDDYINLSGLPLFPFGFGLSYTTFQYSDIRLSKNNILANDSVTVSFTLTNTGTRAGDEVTQLYIRDIIASVARPVLELKGFRRIHLAPGQSKQVTFTIEPSMLRMLNEKMEYVTEPGDFRIMIGSSSRSLFLKETLKVH